MQGLVSHTWHTGSSRVHGKNTLKYISLIDGESYSPIAIWTPFDMIKINKRRNQVLKIPIPNVIVASVLPAVWFPSEASLLYHVALHCDVLCTLSLSYAPYANRYQCALHPRIMSIMLLIYYIPDPRSREPPVLDLNVYFLNYQTSMIYRWSMSSYNIYLVRTEVRLDAVKSLPNALAGRKSSMQHSNTRFVPKMRFFSLAREREFGEDA